MGRVLRVIPVAVLGLVAGVLPVSEASGQEPLAPVVGFSAADRQWLGERGADEVVRVMLVGRTDAGDELAGAVRARDGQVRVSDDRAGFVAADVPAAQAVGLAGEPGLVSIGVDRPTSSGESQDQPDGRPAIDGGQAGAEGGTAPAAEAPDVGPINPYLPTGQIGAPQFVEAHPRYDGRGVRIALITFMPDWTAPGLQATTTGRRKITRYSYGGTDHLVATDRVVAVVGGRFTVDGRTYVMPSGSDAATVRFGTLREQGLDIPADLNFDGDDTDTFGVVAVDRGRRGTTVMVDTDLNISFAGETELTDWNRTQATATLGRDNPQTANRIEGRPFGFNACQTRGADPCARTVERPGELWDLVIGFNTSAEASAAVGHNMQLGDGRFDGVAPGAELWVVSPPNAEDPLRGTTLAAAVLQAARQGPDVIDVPFTYGRGFFPGRIDVLSALVDNIVDAYQIPVTTHASGPPGLGMVDTAPQASRKALTAGAYLHPETYAVLYGRQRIGGERLYSFSGAGHGPHRSTGRPLPDVVAPSPTLFAYPRWQPSGTLPSGPLPPGYSFGFAWALASPQAAGAMALLISAARAEHFQYNPHILKRALELGARPLRGDHAFSRAEVGGGLLQVEAAWRWLERLARDRATDRDLTTLVASDVLAGTGHAIYQRSTTRDIEHVTLSSRDRHTRSYRLSADQPWVRLGSPILRLPGAHGNRRGEATFMVGIDPALRARPGLHTATVTLDDPATTDPADHQVPVTVITPLRFDPANGNRIHISGQGATGIPAATTRQLFIEIPPGSQRLLLENTLPATAPAGVQLYYTPNHAQPNPTPFINSEPAPGTTNPSTITNPDAGTMGLVLDAFELGRPPDRPTVARHTFDITITLDPPTTIRP